MYQNRRKFDRRNRLERELKWNQKKLYKIFSIGKLVKGTTGLILETEPQIHKQLPSCTLYEYHYSLTMHKKLTGFIKIG